MSHFVSTRNNGDLTDARNAMIRGLSRDGGLYAPVTIPTIDYNALKGLSYSEIAQRILCAWFDDLSAEDIKSCCEQAYLYHFDTPMVAPVIKANDSYIVELFHGETCAFKDVALSILPRLLVKSKASLGINEKVLILTATSGDTGSAAMNGFRDVSGTGIITFYPHGGVSPLQRRQMVCMEGSNLRACAVKGNFDDCQSAVKKAFAELPKIDGISFSSANSINIARLVPQISYYFSTYLDLLSKDELICGEPLNFVVPTGNFGDILAGYYAKRMGLPIGKLICASNNVLTEFINTGVYNKNRPFLKTCSPSMDILISSNLERLLYHVQSADSKLVSAQMTALKDEGCYKVDEKVVKAIQNEFAAYSFNDDAVVATIKSFFEESGYLADPHTAVALAAEKAFKAQNPGSKCAVLSTASPFKFVSCISKALHLDEKDNVFDTIRMISDKCGIKAPDSLAGLETKTELYSDVIEKDQIIDYVLTSQEQLFRP